MAGNRSEAPRPPKMAQKMMTGSRVWAKTMAVAPIAYPSSPMT